MKAIWRSLLSRQAAVLVALLINASAAIADDEVPFGPPAYPPGPGMAHPDLSAFDQDGQGFNLFAQQGRAVVLHWCAVWCQPCQASAEAEAAFVAGLDAELGSGAWVLIDALVQDVTLQPSDQTDAQQWRAVLGTPARTLHAENSTGSELYLLGSQIGVFPTYVVVDIFGNVSGTVEGFDPSTLDRLADLVRDGVNPPVFIDSFES